MGELFWNDLQKILGLKWEQLTVPAFGIGIDSDQRLTIEVLERVRHESILTYRDDCIVWSKDKVRQEFSVDHLDASEQAQNIFGFTERFSVAFRFSLIFGEVRALVLDIKAGLFNGVETGDEVIETSRPFHENDFIFGQTFHFRAPLVSNNSRSRSGEMFN